VYSDRLIEFLKEEKKKSAALLVLVLLLLLFIASCGKTKDTTDSESADASGSILSGIASGLPASSGDAAEYDFETYEEEEVAEVVDLINRYYTAYAAADIDTILKIATPVSDLEQGYIRLMSKYIKSYSDITCYTKSGYEDGAYFVTVTMKMHLKKIDTAAPGAETFFVRTNENGELYIDNVYSMFNLSNEEYPVDEGVVALIDNYKQESDIKDVLSEVQEKYTKAVTKDKKLGKMVNKTIPNAFYAWAQKQTANDTTAVADSSDTQQTDNSSDTASKKDTASAQEQTDESTASDSSETTTKKKNKKKSTKKKTTKKNKNKKKDTTTDTANTSEETQDSTESTPDSSSSVPYFSVGEQIRLTSATVVRVSMSETASRVGTAYAGEYLTVIMSYQEGWTKVSWGEKTGYVKTEVLKAQ
jgi:chemotaxis protein histidine kinase CheA